MKKPGAKPTVKQQFFGYCYFYLLPSQIPYFHGNINLKLHCGTLCFFHLDEIIFIISWFYLDKNGSPFYRPNWVTHFRLSYLFMTTLSSSLNHSSLYRASVSIYSMDDLKHFISLSMYRASSVSFTLLQRPSINPSESHFCAFIITQDTFSCIYWTMEAFISLSI